MEIVAIPGSIREIGEHAFAGCEKLCALALGEGLRVIGRGAFSNCAIESV